MARLDVAVSLSCCQQRFSDMLKKQKVESGGNAFDYVPSTFDCSFRS
jgi:hypothetical protein